MECPTTQCRGLIPARAGNTNSLGTERHDGRAHPRSRGEHCWVNSQCASMAGSSPLARGTPGAASLLLRLAGLIPARAGNTEPIREVHESLRAHPRSRGEHHQKTSFPFVFRGSSPLARGTPGISVMVRLTQGLIPARAGNTLPTERAACRRGAHPRSRGEHTC